MSFQARLPSHLPPVPELSWFILRQCRRFAAVRDGLGAGPIDEVAAAIENTCEPRSSYEIFGMLHELVRRIESAETNFRWFPPTCLFPSDDEMRLLALFTGLRGEREQDIGDIAARLCRALEGAVLPGNSAGTRRMAGA
jgi:hypothetical protein